MPPISHPTAEDRQWRRRRRKGSRTGGPLHGLRIRELEIILKHRWGKILPDDDAGRDDARLMLHHLVHYAVDPRGRMAAWLAMRCPWMPRLDAEQIVEHIIAHPRRFKADTLAAKLNLTAADRARWKITTIGAIDLLREQRVAARRERDRQRKIRNRRARGVQQRAKYLASVITKSKPWEAAGMSRATWYRRRRETGSGDSIGSVYAADTCRLN